MSQIPFNIEVVEPIIDIGSDTTICKRDSIVVASYLMHPKAQYLWSTDDTISQITVCDSGTYWLRGSIAHCQDTDSIHIARHIPENTQLEDQYYDRTICVSDTLFAAESNVSDRYSWNTGETTSYKVVEKTGHYEVYTENQCDDATVMYDITVETLREGLHDYNVFTPNKDGENELFTIYEGDAEDYQLEIYNRWGRLIWETGNPNEHWDGGNVSDGVYYYHLSFTNCANEAVERKGTVEVRR